MNLHWLITLCLAGLVGCDRLPQLAPVSGSVPGEVVTDTGRGTYDWKLNRLDGQLSFDMPRQTFFKFVEQLDTEQIKQNAYPLKYVEPTDAVKPEWMEDDVYEWVRRFTEPPPEPKAILTLKFSEEIGKAHVMNSQGTRVLTLGTKLIEWDIATGKRICQWDAPIKDGRQMFYDTDEQTVVILDHDKVHRVSLADGQIKHTWTCPDGELINVVRARDKDVVAVVTAKMGIYALASNFKVERVYKGEPLISRSIAVHPEGKCVVGTIAGRLLRWHLNKPETPAEVIPGDQLDEHTMASSGWEFDRWTSPNMIQEITQATGKLTKRQDIPFLTTNGFMALSWSGTVTGKEDWLVVLSARGNFDGSYTRFIEDILVDGAMHSVPWMLPVENAETIAANRSSEVISIASSDQLQVFHRRRWVDPDGLRTAMRLSTLLEDGRMEQMDKVAEYIRDQKVVRGNQTGEHVYGMMADQVAYRWAYLEKNPPSPELMQKIQAWYQRGSPLALLASGVRHQQVGLEARGGGYANTVKADDWKIMEERLRLSNKDLQKLIRSDRPAAKAIEEFLTNMKYTSYDFDDAEPLLKIYTERYPLEHRAYAVMCLWLLPRWGGEMGEGGALVGAVADKMPAPQSEIFYAQVVTQMTAIFMRQILPETGLNESRAVKAAELMMERELLTRAQTELLMELAYATRDQALGDKLGRYHLKHFDIPGAFIFVRPGVNALHQIKLDSLKPLTQSAQR